MSTPVVVLPNPWKAMIQLLAAHPQLPAELVGKVAERLPDDFPEGLPFLHVVKVPGGRRDVRMRLATALFDLNIYHADLFEADELARQVAGVVQSIEGRSTAACGFTVVRLVDEPFPAEDPDSTAERVIIPISATFRPM